MENENRICPCCSTENEEKYVYCKNCGNKLPIAEPEPITDPFTGYPYRQSSYVHNETPTGETASEAVNEDIPNENPQPNHQNEQPFQNQPPNQNTNTYNTPPVYNYNQPYTQNNYQQPNPTNMYIDTIDGIPYGEVAVFVGKKAHKYMPVFSKMEITSSNINWHWPAAVLGFIFGPLGAALWYFFRKMYKHAFILAAIGIVVTVATSLITGPVLTEINPADIFDYIAGEGAEDTLIPELDSIEFNISNTITNIVDLATAVICGLFTHSWYKKHIKNSILNYRSKGIDPRYYPIGLASLGGTSGGMLTLGIFIMIFSENLATIFTKLINMI